MSSGSKVGISSWVAVNTAYFAFPSLAALGLSANNLTLGSYPPLSVAGYNASFTDLVF